MEFVIKDAYINEINVEKSRFIAYFFPVSTKEEFLNEFTKIKKEHNKAKHHCYAYKINGDIKYSDDGEPQGTAGKPILNVLESKNLTDCAIVVVRYFGGTLLGSGRLLRTYSLSASSVVANAKFYEVIEENEISVELDLDYYDIFKNYLFKNHFIIKSTIFNDRILIVFYAPLNFKENLDSIFFPKVKTKEIKAIKHEKEVI
jgi:uncharacterized YigZ family protein